MAGHSKWANIKHRKGAVDAKRGKVFNRLVKELMVAAKLSGSDPDSNPRLRIAMSKARAANMPRDTMERAVKKGAGELEGQNFEEISYEIYAPGGVGIIVDALTDKKSRTTPEIKSMINKHGCNLAEPGAVSRLFLNRGNIVIEKEHATEDELMELVLEAGAEDMVTYDEYYEIFTEPGDYSGVAEALAAKEIPTQVSEIRMIPLEGTEVEVADKDKAGKLMKILDKFEDQDDVQSVVHNANIPDEIMEALD